MLVRRRISKEKCPVHDEERRATVRRRLRAWDSPRKGKQGSRTGGQDGLRPLIPRGVRRLLGFYGTRGTARRLRHGAAGRRTGHTGRLHLRARTAATRMPTHGELGERKAEQQRQAHTNRVRSHVPMLCPRRPRVKADCRYFRALDVCKCARTRSPSNSNWARVLYNCALMRR